MSRRYSAGTIVLFRARRWRVVAVDFSSVPERIELESIDAKERRLNISVRDVVFEVETVDGVSV